MNILIVLMLLQQLPNENGKNPSITIEELIKNVESSENLYKDMAIETTTEYNLLKKVAPVIAIRNSIKTRKWIAQDKYVRYEFSENSTDILGKKYDISEQISYDGEKTRIRHNTIINVKDGKSISGVHYFRPHTAIFERSTVCYPLSVLLKGDEAIAICDNAESSKKFNHKISILGSEKYEGLNCLKLEIICTFKDNPNSSEKLSIWLAVDKNYIPAKLMIYDCDISKDIPLITCQVTQWRELMPGIWHPIKWSTDAIDDYELRKTGKIVPANHESVKVDSVINNPNLDKSKIVELTYKEGDTYYEVNIADRIVRGGFLQSKDTSSSSKSTISSWLSYTFLILALLLLIAGGYVYRRS